MQSALLKNRARAMRKAPSDAERIVWSLLKRDQLGLRFRRQFPLGNYIVDFVCFQKRVIVEVDGSQHQQASDYDAHRDAWLRAQGFDVLRFWNSDVFTNREGVAARIVETCMRR
jgi:BirA family biotin operon repressor/biotin-[acetyl-CoA-carboxylase] ligase